MEHAREVRNQGQMMLWSMLLKMSHFTDGQHIRESIMAPNWN